MSEKTKKKKTRNVKISILKSVEKDFIFILNSWWDVIYNFLSFFYFWLHLTQLKKNLCWTIFLLKILDEKIWRTDFKQLFLLICTNFLNWVIRKWVKNQIVDSRQNKYMKQVLQIWNNFGVNKCCTCFKKR